MQRILLSATAALLLAGCAAHDTGWQYKPVDRACIEGLTPARVAELQAWVAAEMGVGSEFPPSINCGSPGIMAALYSADAKAHLGAYDRVAGAIWLADSRRYPDGNEHILVHELAHHLQWASGLARGMSAVEREAQAEAVHERWMEE